MNDLATKNGLFICMNRIFHQNPHLCVDGSHSFVTRKIRLSLLSPFVVVVVVVVVVVAYQ